MNLDLQTTEAANNWSDLDFEVYPVSQNVKFMSLFPDVLLLL